ncbi:hypothetical protein ABH908_000248 [Pseudomonas frederiksbergensis]|uniref:hypothetical protein n=1 Tax=Pseudomonas TaxID=286 RepID=UPI003D201152
MMTFLNLLVLFFTAVMAGRKLAARGYRIRGLTAFTVLLGAYLLLWFHVWLVGGLLLAAATWFVLHSINLPLRDVLPANKDSAN